MRSTKKKGPPAKKGGKSKAGAVKKVAAPASSFSTTRHGASRLAALGGVFDQAGWPSAAETLREVRAVPTIYPGVDVTLGVGGWPTDRFGLIHGPSNEGKTTFVLGLMRSFLTLDHPAAFIDAERSTPKQYARQLMGEWYDSPGFRAMYPTTFEATVDAVRKWAEALGNAREKGLVDKDTTGILVLDSIRKLVPARLLEKLLKEGSEGDPEATDWRGRKKKGAGVDGMSGRANQYKAALNAAWMDELTVLLAQTGTCLVAIGREYEATDQGGPGNFGDDFKLGGGSAIYFESSVVARVGREKALVDEGGHMIGEQHFVQVRKTKIAGKERRYPLAHFHTRTGVDGAAAGFDFARDVLVAARDRGIVETSGAWLAFDGKSIGQGENATLAKLARDEELLHRIDAALRASVVIESVPPPAPALEAAPAAAAS